MTGAMKASSVASSTAGRVRAGGETIGEVAAIARQTASQGEAVSPAAGPTPADENRHDSQGFSGGPRRNLAAESDSDGTLTAERVPQPTPLRRSRAGAGLVKEPVQSPLADKTAMHFILAGRAYAYGQRIVRKEEGKLGDLLAIKS